MSRRSIELLLLVVVTVILCILNPLELEIKGGAAKHVYNAVAYMVPSAFITILLSKIIYKFKK